MCGRFTLTVTSLEQVAEAVDAEIEWQGLAYRPRYNVAPTDQHWFLRTRENRRVLVPGRWGLINPWAKSRHQGVRQFNARSETLGERPAYRVAYQRHRCLVPADGFYEWTGDKGSRKPLRYHLPSQHVGSAAGGLFWMAGLYSRWSDGHTGEVVTSFTVITTTPNATVAPVHDRMPVILREPSALDRWLAKGDPAANLLKPAPDEALVASAASTRVNRAGEDDAALLDPAEPGGGGQLSLF